MHCVLCPVVTIMCLVALQVLDDIEDKRRAEDPRFVPEVCGDLPAGTLMVVVCLDR